MFEHITWSALFRRRNVCALKAEESQLGRVLSTTDLTLLGIGSTLGVGIYILPGTVAREIAGPGAVLSFFIASIVSIFAGFCYAELGSRVPKAGSAYIYTFITIGEFIAFLVGWNLILENIIGTASVARGLSVYVDSMMNNTLQHNFQAIVRIPFPFLSPYLDFFALAISVVLAVMLAVGLKESVILNNVLTSANLFIVAFVIILGCFKVDWNNWNIPASQVPPGEGVGGFLPYGIQGVIRGAATCFYGFVGFDGIATTGEEVRKPEKAVPFAIIVSLSVVFVAYFGISMVLTLMYPYYLQDPDTPFPHVFAAFGWTWAQYIVSVGAIFGLFASLMGCMYPLTRIIYSMANDGLIFKSLGVVHPSYKTPFFGTIVSGTLTGLMAAIFDLEQLIDLMSIGTLFAYTIVSACIIILRYREESDEEDDLLSEEYKESTHLLPQDTAVSRAAFFSQIFNLNQLPRSTYVTSYVVNAMTTLFGCLAFTLSLLLVYRLSYLFVILNIALMLVTLFSITLQPQSSKKVSFKVPYVPYIPALSMFFNICLMCLLDFGTWFRFVVWLVVGFGVYFTYSIRHSSENHSKLLSSSHDSFVSNYSSFGGTSSKSRD
uniref:Cationic amino acid transporter 2 n=1 Tax=Cacopsylla melanoneura TaxID=428564 RepID=A0A8D8VCW7_9HEMI